VKKVTDTFTKAKRSYVMSRIRSHGNKSTELKLMAFFRKNKFTGWRRKSKIFGKPDFIFPKHKVAAFVDGCFWHGHNCRSRVPSSNVLYWAGKIIKNRSRDKLVNKTLKRNGWLIIRVWECEIKNEKRLLKRFSVLKSD
jgi:DNA mismatch endonuclease, patch repair protein